MPKICQKYAKNMLKNMHTMQKNMHNMEKLCKKYAEGQTNMQHFQYARYAK